MDKVARRFLLLHRPAISDSILYTFPNKIRSQGQAHGSFVDWIVNAVIGLVFPIALTLFGGGDVFMFFAVLLMPFFFVLRFMPETKGKSHEELEKLIVVEDGRSSQL